ncbi:cytochrome c biogenesis protein ResB [Pelistega indica]|nr:cytochrome c biogenesis protein ResB [Pelistega indica]
MQKYKRRWGAELLELFGSMRFAIYLLMIICIASAIGTLLEQNREEIFYIDRFGTYWYQVFSKFSVSQIYNTWWFLVVMAFLVISTSLCLIRNVPKFVKEMRSFKEYVRQSSLKAFPHKIDIQTPYTADQAVNMSKVWLKKQGYAFKEKVEGETVLLASRKGSSNRLGYIFAHLAIVVICIGGLLDSELPNRLQIWFEHKQPIPAEAKFVSDLSPASKFGVHNLSFRGNVSISEGDSSNYALLALGEDTFLQNLPFDIKLNKFIIEYYQMNGMPKRFASDVTITDHETGKSENQIIEVNHPYQLHGVTLYQSSFNDGGSKLTLKTYALKEDKDPNLELKTRVGQTSAITTMVDGKPQTYQLRVDDFRPINVENLSTPESLAKPKNFQEQILAVTGSAASKHNANLHNVGPLVKYTLTDDKNQSVQYQNYMLPVELDGKLVFLIGLKLPTDAGFSYIRIPADEKTSMDEFFALKEALENPEMRLKAAQAYAARVDDPRIDRKNIVALADRALGIFAKSGFKGIDDYVDGVGVPEAERVPANIREPMKGILRDYLVFSAIDLRNMAREKIGLPVLNYVNQADAEKQAMWFDTAIRALSDISFYPAPVVLQLKTFEHIQGTVLQATRSPGKYVVYLGCLFLILGVFQMFYVRERRLWLWVVPSEHGSEIKAAMSSQKRTMDFLKEFEKFKQDFSELERK